MIFWTEAIEHKDDMQRFALVRSYDNASSKCEYTKAHKERRMKKSRNEELLRYYWESMQILMFSALNGRCCGLELKNLKSWLKNNKTLQPANMPTVNG